MRDDGGEEEWCLMFLWDIGLWNGEVYCDTVNLINLRRDMSGRLL